MGTNQFTKQNKQTQTKKKPLNPEQGSIQAEDLGASARGRVLPWHARGPGNNSQHCRKSTNLTNKTNIHVPILSLILFEEITLVLHL